MSDIPAGRADGQLGTDDLVAPDVPIDLDNCAREPIHIPGSVQPRGVLLVVREPEYTVAQVSANITTLLGVEVADVLDAALSVAIGAVPAQAVQRAAAAFTDLRERNPLEVELLVDGDLVAFDAILHRQSVGVLLLELEHAHGPRPFSFPNTYQSVRGAVGELNQAVALSDLYEITARAVRELTGFDRVMIYRYDHEYNGEVVAEDCRSDLDSFLGLHYPATDIPAQARAMYERNWLRLISDVDYVPAPLLPTLSPMTGEPIDLTHATLRSVSPIHIEYLQNMGVRASMSISLLRDGRLWGLIACHHYSGPHVPPYGTRAAAEFLGSTLSLRLVDRQDDESVRDRIATQATLAKITAAMLDESEALDAVLLGDPHLLDLVPATGVAVAVNGVYDTRGVVPDEATVHAVAQWARDRAEDVVGTESLVRSVPDTAFDPAVTSGALVVTLPQDQFVIWFRPEEVRAMDWGGDPNAKAFAVQEVDGIRLSPRRSFARWREIVRQRSQPWTAGQLDSASDLRRHLLESMYQRSRSELRLAETLQRSLLPEILTIDGWDLTAHYAPAESGRIGGDWYDAFVLRDGRTAVVLGDVAGHGITAAGTMAQLRNALRAYLLEDPSPAAALGRLNRFAVELVPRSFATVAVLCIDTISGDAEVALAGHPSPLSFRPGSTASSIALVTSPPIGVTGITYRSASLTIEPGSGLVLFSDGVVERRGEDLDAGVGRLAGTVGRVGVDGAQAVWNDVVSALTDDATIVALYRPA